MTPPPAARSHWVLLALPFAYFLATRVPGGRQRIGWVFSYLLPVLALAALAHGGADGGLAGALGGLLAGALAVAAVYTAYEFGYIVNDVAAVERESAPTLRAAAATRAWLAQRLGVAFVVRAAAGAALAAAALALGGGLASWAWFGWIALWPLFAAYNWWRGRVTLLLYVALVGLRFQWPIWAATVAGGAALPGWPWLLALYALPTTYVAAWKPRYGLGVLQRRFGTETRFRVAWHALLAAAALGATAAWPRTPAIVFAALAAYYLALRLLAALAERGMHRGSLGVALRNMAWVLGDKALAMALGLLTFGMLGRTLGPAGAGHFAFAAALLQVGLGLSLVCSAGPLLPRFCRMHAGLPGAVANVFAVRLVASVVAAAAMVLYTVLAIGDETRRTVALILVLAVPLIEPFAIAQTYWSSRNHNRPTVVARSSSLIVRTLWVALGLALGAPPWLLALAWIVESALSAALQTWQLRRALGHARLRRFVTRGRSAAYLRFGLRFVLGSWLHVLFTRVDRLLLAERMPAETFGLYATAMQLMDVWVQVASLVGVSLATAYLYGRMREGGFARAFVLCTAAMTGLGLVGLAGAAWLGVPLLRGVFGPQFVAGQPFLVWGAALAVLLFANQVVQLTLAGLDRARALVTLWTVAVAVAAFVVWFGFDRLGPAAGPIGLATGLVAGWISLVFTYPRQA